MPNLKKLIIVLLLIVLLLQGVFFIAFTKTGNTWMLPYLNDYLAKNVKEAKVELTYLSLKPGSLSAVAKVNEGIDVKVQGPIDLWEESFDLGYKVDAQKIQSEAFSLQQPLHIKGKATGKAEKMYLTGEGEAFASNVVYDMHLIDNQPQNIKAKIKDADISEMLAIAGQAPYASGRMSLDIDMPTFDPKQPKGDAKLLINDGVLHTKIVQQEHNISLGKDIPFSTDLVLKTEGKSLSTTGKIVSTLANIVVNQSRYELQEQKLKDLKLDITQASIGTLLKLAGEKPYVTGEMALKADFPEVDPEHLEGKVHLKVDKATIVAKSLKEAYGIDIGKNSTLRADIDTVLKGERVDAKGDIATSLATLVLDKTRYHLKKGDLSSDYALDIADLARLQTLTQRPMEGTLKVDGSVNYRDKVLDIKGVTNSLGGKSSFELLGDTLNATLSKVQSGKLLQLLGQPNYTKGMVDGSVSLTSLEKMNGKFELKSKGAVNTTVVKKVHNLNLGKSVSYNGTFNGVLKDQKVYAKSNWWTTMAKFNLPDVTYDLKRNILQSSYHMEIPDLGKLQPLTKRRFRGDMVFDGKVTMDKMLKITGHGKEFDGTVDFTLAGEWLRAHAIGATVSKVAYMLNYPQILEASSELKVNYHIPSGVSTLDATLDSARILPNKLTVLIKQLIQFDLVRESYDNAKLKAKITPKDINFNFDARNSRSHIKVPKGWIDKRSERVDLKIDLRLDDKDLKATVQGTLRKPKVNIDSSAYLKKKVIEKIFKKDKEPKELGEEKIKGLLKGIF